MGFYFGCFIRSKHLSISYNNTEEFAVVKKLAVRSEDLQGIFEKYNPYVVHFCGHGAGEEGLVFESDRSGEQLVSNQALSGLFNLYAPDVKCVLLNACTTKIQADEIGEHVPYVISTSREILDKAAYLFAVGFYEALSSNNSIEYSFAKGCLAIKLELPNAEIVPETDPTWRKAKVIGTTQTLTATKPLEIILTSNLRLAHPDLSANTSPDFKQAIHQEGRRRDYRNNLRDVLDCLGKTTIEREKPISPFEYEQRQTFLKNVKEFWIEGFLEPSFYFNTAIDKNRGDSSQIMRPLDNLEVIPTDIDSSYDKLHSHDIMGQIGDGKTLLILGDPGSGKTIALLQLAEKLIKQTQQDMTKPIPVVFNLSSWGQKQQPLTEWLIEELKEKYQVYKTWSEAWIENQQLTLLLDGLDEVKENCRNACVRAINKFVATHLETEIVVCSRVKDYEAIAERLLLSSAVYIQPLSKKQLADFLKNVDDSLLGLKTAIEQDREIAEFARTPLILNMMTWTYQGWSVEECRKQFQVVQDRESNLFESYIEKNLNQENREAKYSKDRVVHWLSWLAKTMVDESKIIFLIEKMQPTMLESQSERGWYLIGNFLLGWLSCGLILGLRGELIRGLIFGLSGGLIAGASPEINLFEQMSWSWQRVESRVFREGLFVWLISGLIGAINSGLIEGLIEGLFVGLFVGLIGAINSGMSSTEVKQRAIPNQGIWSSGKNSITIRLFVGLIFWLIFGLGIGLFAVLNFGLSSGLSFLLSGGLILGLGIMLYVVQNVGLLNGGATCIKHYNLRRILFRKGRIPQNYADFLDYASDRRLMKKVGGGYVFYHRMLMEHFARNRVSNI